jgi:hypothetical protein
MIIEALLEVVRANIFCNLLVLAMSFSTGVSWYNDGLQAGRPGFDSRHYKIFLFSTVSRQALGPTQPPIQ